jgi:hypothetical protein
MESNHIHNEQRALSACTLNSLLAKQTVLVQQIVQHKVLSVAKENDIVFDGAVS